MHEIKVWKNTRGEELNCILGFKNFFSNLKSLAADLNTKQSKREREREREDTSNFILVPLTNRE
jgi:hypothetical protein